MQYIFLDELGNIRSGWRILLFLLMLFAVMSIVFFTASLVITDIAYYSPLIIVICLFIATALMLKMFEKRPIRSVGLPFHRRMPLELGQGALIGGLMITAVFAVYFASGWIAVEWRGLTAGDAACIAVSALLFYAIAGFGEELLFRGYPFQTLAESIKPPAAVIIMSVAFSAGHALNPNLSWLGLFNIFLAGVWLSAAYLKTRTLWFPTGLHVSWNFFQGTVFSFPVSGISVDDKALFSGSVEGPALLTGGEFGPEGGLIATAVLIAGTVYIYKSRFIKLGDGVWTVERYIREELERYQK